MRMGEFVDEWYVCEPRRMESLLVTRDQRTSCAVLRVVAQLAQCALVERSFPSVEVLS